MPPPASHQQGRINLSGLKSQIAKQLGPDRTQMYFCCLNRLLSQKLSKTEFSKLCLVVLGRENIALHNKLIRSILKNAYESKTPPPIREKSALDQSETFPKKSLQVKDPLRRLQNGSILPKSPRKWTCNFDRKSPLGSNEIAIKENGLLGPCDWKRPVGQLAKMPQTENSIPRDQVPLHSKDLVEGAAMKVEKKFEESIDPNSTKRPLRAPLGVPFCPPSVGGARRSLLSGSSNYCNGELCHDEDLRKRMEKVAETQEIGVTLDCANLLNNALDTYLKQLIMSTVELARPSSKQESSKCSVFKQQVNETAFNGIWPGNQMHIQNNVVSLNVNNEYRNPYIISLQDFQVAMELNPKQLGENWPLLFEKLCIRSYEG